MSPKNNTIVIGAGISGLTAAYQLQKKGHDVLVLEAHESAGGRMATVNWEGFKVDVGAKFVTSSDKTLLEMVDEVGLTDQLVREGEGLTITIYRDGKLHSANFLNLLSYFSWSGVSLAARFAMLKLIPHFFPLLGFKDVYHLERNPLPDTEETFEEFFKNKISEEMFEYWAIPMFETMCSYSGKDVSRTAFLALMASYLNADSVTFKEGIGALPDAIAARLKVELGALVRGVEINRDGSGAQVRYTQGGSEKTITAPLVVVAVPGNHALKLFPDPRPAWKVFFPKVGYSSGALHYHILETDYQPEVPGTMIPRALGLALNGISFEAYQDGRWLLMTDPSHSHFIPGKSEKEYEKEALETAVKIYPQIEGTFRAHRLFAWDEKVPTFRPGYLDALAAFWADPQEGPVYFCGDYFAGPSTGGALFTGLECVERIGKQ
ncbi:MAG: NAD(P)/FAD-dependent oxidoreductase [Anaerolineales bacterium]